MCGKKEEKIAIINVFEKKFFSKVYFSNGKILFRVLRLGRSFKCPG